VSDQDDKVNLAKATVVVLDGSQHSLDVTCQILKGFGVGAVQRFDSIVEADKYLQLKPADLVVADPAVEEGAGYDFIKTLRRGGGANAFVPIVLISGHVKKTDVAKGRDVGANFVVAKPLSASVLLQRILWVSRDRRPFVQIDSGYVGPDRRFKFEGPPPGSDGRRDSDLKSPLGSANEPNLSQDEVDAMIKPQKFVL
jgi:CheY-like chemotaxis protein